MCCAASPTSRCLFGVPSCLVVTKWPAQWDAVAIKTAQWLHAVCCEAHKWVLVEGLCVLFG